MLPRITKCKHVMSNGHCGVVVCTSNPDFEVMPSHGIYILHPGFTKKTLNNFKKLKFLTKTWVGF